MPVSGRAYYYRARFYNAATGRFISEDPVGFDGGVNFYSYANDSPIDENDPLGLFKHCFKGIKIGCLDCELCLEAKPGSGPACDKIAKLLMSGKVPTKDDIDACIQESARNASGNVKLTCRF